MGKRGRERRLASDIPPSRLSRRILISETGDESKGPSIYDVLEVYGIHNHYPLVCIWH